MPKFRKYRTFLNLYPRSPTRIRRYRSRGYRNVGMLRAYYRPSTAIVIILVVVAILLSLRWLSKNQIFVEIINSPNAGQAMDVTKDVIVLNSVTAIEKSVVRVDATVNAPLSILSLELEYLDSEGNVFLTEYAEFENLDIGTHYLEMNTNPDVDLYADSLRVNII